MKTFTRFGKLAAVVFVLMMITSALSADPVKLNNNSNSTKITGNTDLGFKVVFSFSEFSTLDVKTPKGIFTRIIIPSYSKLGEFGSPEFPVSSQLIEIPEGAQVVLNSLNSVIKEYNLRDLGIEYPLMPNQPPVPKTGEKVDFIYDKSAYRNNEFGPVRVVSVDDLGTMRGVRIGRLNIAPVEYNPVTGVIRVYEKLEFEVVFDGADLAKTESNKEIYSNHYFAPFYHTLVNYREPQAGNRENFTRYPIKYVIVSDRMFEAQLQPFIEWKIKKGFNVIEAYTDDPNVGSTTSQIKNYLQALYENATPEDPAPTFVLFVGDVAQIPVFYGQAANHETDLYYCEYTGDYFPEVFYGRFSAQNTSQLQPQIDKSLMLEQYTMPVTSYQDTVVMVAGMDGTYGPVHANGQINYGTENYFNASNGIYSHTYLYPQSGGLAAQMRQNVSQGVCFANYTAHGSPSGWADPSFSVGDIPALQNNGKYGLLVGNCCSTSEYEVGECFAEAIVRAAHKGAVGYIGASNSTYWDEDYYFGIGVGAIAGDPPSYEETTLGAYDRMFHTHGEAFAEWYTTMDQMVFAGNLAVTLGSPGSAEYYWEAYCLMGDPSLMIYFSVPPEMEVSYEPLLPMGSVTFTINTAPYAYVGLSMNGQGIGTALAGADGVAVVTLVNVPGPGTADVVVTAQNYQPYIGTVLIANPSGPYVMLNETIINDMNGDFDGVPEFGEDILLSAELKNWGSGDADNTITVLSSDDEYITIVENSEDFGTIPAQDSVMREDAFRFSVDDYVPDLHVVPFSLTIESQSRETWNSDFSVVLYAPVIEIGSLLVDDSANGNSNGRLDPGETVDLVLECKNTGHCDALTCLTVLQSSSPYITLGNTTVTFDTIGFDAMKQAVFSATLADAIPEGTLIDLHFDLTSGAYNDAKLFNSPVGLVIEDFETGDFSSFGWVMAGTMPWQITEENVFDGIFSARSGIIGDDQVTSLSVDINVVMDDSISFFRKVSCEDDPYNDDYDYLAFYVDDAEIARWDGELDWSRVAYAIPAGQHTFKWTFRKDYSVAAGLDAGFVDNIIFPAMAPIVSVNDPVPVKDAGLFITPNPAKDHAVLYFMHTEGDVKVAVYNISGNKVKEIEVDRAVQPGKNQVSLDTHDLAPGMYFCVMTAGAVQDTEKLIISK
jgi:hypothetical protein